MSMDVPVLEIDQFARSVGVNVGSPHALFLGAGASQSSGVPTAAGCISEWKRSIFVSNNPAMKDYVAELSLRPVQERIDRWLRTNGHWPSAGVDEYSYFIEKCLPVADDRRRFFEPWVRRARPHTGYQLVCLLAEAGLFKSVWTTNFDSLVVRASAASNMTAIEIGIDTQHRASRQPSQSELLCVSLHGDYRYDLLANTSAELQEQEVQLKAALTTTLQTHSLIVSGYSGRDASVMRVLTDALSQPGHPTKVYWCGLSDEANENVGELLTKIRAARREAFYVPGATFDDAMVRLATSCLSGELGQKAVRIVGSATESKTPKREPFAAVHAEPTDLIKSNAWPIRCPTEVFSFELKEWPNERVWHWVREQTSGHQVVAAPFKKRILALGTLDGIQTAFESCLTGKIQRVPISERDFKYEDGAVISILQTALVVAIADKCRLEHDGKRRLWEQQVFKIEEQAGKQYSVHRSIRIALRSIGERLYGFRKLVRKSPQSDSLDCRIEIPL